VRGHAVKLLDWLRGVAWRRPNPGSKQARKQGCSCSQADNNYGRTAPWWGVGWFVDQDCRVHYVVDPIELGAW
jgi:hypothetical protein